MMMVKKQREKITALIETGNDISKEEIAGSAKITEGLRCLIEFGERG